MNPLQTTTPLCDVSLTLFLTKGNSLQTWDQNGILRREMSLYQALRPHLASLTIVSFGGAADMEIASAFDDIRVIANTGKQIQWRYYWSWLKQLQPNRAHIPIFKSNQVQGAEFAVAAARHFNGRSIARCGYLISDFAEREKGSRTLAAVKARLHERLVFKSADHCIVTTEEMAKRLRTAYNIARDRIEINPNFVDTICFAPKPDVKPHDRTLFFAGRLEPQKNILNLIHALEGQNISLTLAGEGSLRAQIANLANDLNVPITFLGRIPNETLPEHIARHTAFVAPSLFEGHPKALIEAMACGAAIITTRVSGIDSLFVDGETGILSDTDPLSLRNAVRKVVESPDLADRLGQQARTFAENNFSLSRAVGRELALLTRLTTSGTQGDVRTRRSVMSRKTNAGASYSS